MLHRILQRFRIKFHLKSWEKRSLTIRIKSKLVSLIHKDIGYSNEKERKYSITNLHQEKEKSSMDDLSESLA